MLKEAGYCLEPALALGVLPILPINVAFEATC